SETRTVGAPFTVDLGLFDFTLTATVVLKIRSSPGEPTPAWPGLPDPEGPFARIRAGRPAASAACLGTQYRSYGPALTWVARPTACPRAPDPAGMATAGPHASPRPSNASRHGVLGLAPRPAV